jgi:hypothetical protein
MTEAAPAIFVALEASGVAAVIRQSLWLYPAANIGHIVSLVIFAGAIAVMDVRLLGGFRATSPGHVMSVARRFVLIGVFGLALTGAVLFAAEASHLSINPVFRLKVALIALGLINVLIYQLWARPVVEGLAAGASIPTRAKVMGGVSLGLWIVVAACGRSIAYF